MGYARKRIEGLERAFNGPGSSLVQRRGKKARQLPSSHPRKMPRGCPPGLLACPAVRVIDLPHSRKCNSAGLLFSSYLPLNHQRTPVMPDLGTAFLSSQISLLRRTKQVQQYLYQKGIVICPVLTPTRLRLPRMARSPQVPHSSCLSRCAILTTHQAGGYGREGLQAPARGWKRGQLQVQQPHQAVRLGV